MNLLKKETKSQKEVKVLKKKKEGNYVQKSLTLKNSRIEKKNNDVLELL